MLAFRPLYNFSFKCVMHDSSNVAIGLDKMSPKLLIGQCLDMAHSVLREIVSVYCTNNQFEFPLPNQNNDLLCYINYVLAPERFDKITSVFLKENSNHLKSFLKSWLFELKSIRNAWAHWNNGEFELRLVLRSFDTLSLIYSGFAGHPDYDLFKKIELYRKQLLLFSIEQQFSKEAK